MQLHPSLDFDFSDDIEPFITIATRVDVNYSEVERINVSVVSTDLEKNDFKIVDLSQDNLSQRLSPDYKFWIYHPKNDSKMIDYDMVIASNRSTLIAYLTVSYIRAFPESQRDTWTNYIINMTNIITNICGITPIEWNNVKWSINYFH
mgnify:CR=1 FL=1